MRSIKPFVSPNTLKTVYYCYFNAIISYGLPLWGKAPLDIKIFKMQKRIELWWVVTIGSHIGISSEGWEFYHWYIYIFLLMLFVVENKNFFTLNSAIYTKITRQINNFYQPTTNFSNVLRDTVLLWSSGVWRVYPSAFLHRVTLCKNYACHLLGTTLHGVRL
jgi:hypothetical protein